jgi:type IV pilus assembly protein PilP
MIISHISRLTLLTVLLSGLAGCGDGGVQEIKQWMDGVRQSAKISVSKLSEPKKFTPFVYGGKDNVDPYNPAKLAAAFARLKSKSTSELKPDLDRRREPLEGYPLDTLKMVGILQKPGLSYAILQADKTIFQVKVGNYIGQNFGMINQITENEVQIKEIVQDAAGDWVERKATLELQESKK